MMTTSRESDILRTHPSYELWSPSRLLRSFLTPQVYQFFLKGDQEGGSEGDEVGPELWAVEILGDGEGAIEGP